MLSHFTSHALLTGVTLLKQLACVSSSRTESWSCALSTFALRSCFLLCFIPLGHWRSAYCSGKSGVIYDSSQSLPTAWLVSLPLLHREEAKLISSHGGNSCMKLTMHGKETGINFILTRPSEIQANEICVALMPQARLSGSKSHGYQWDLSLRNCASNNNLMAHIQYFILD